MIFTVVNRKNELFKVMIDDQDAKEVLCRKWCVTLKKGKYPRVARKENGRYFQLSHLIMGIPSKGFEVDHINRDTLDNRRSNLRTISRYLNLSNSGPREGTKYKGVYLDKRINRWRAILQIAGKQHYFGSFKSPVVAAKVRDAKVVELVGPEAFLNFPLGVRH